MQFRVGLLVCGTLAVFCGLVLFILGSAFDGPSARYYILFEENVKGMVVGSKVNFQGVPIGSVTDISFRAGRTKVEVTVDPGKATIQDVTRARLDRLLVTGQVTVELEGWHRDATALEHGASIVPKDDPLQQLKASLPELVGQIGATLTRVDSLLASAEDLLGPENRERFARMLESAEAASAELPRLLRTFDARANELGRLTARASELLEMLGGPDAHAALVAGRRAAEGLAGASAELTALLGTLRSPLQSTLLTARESLREIRGLARRLNVAPTSLLFGGQQREIEVPAAPGASR